MKCVIQLLFAGLFHVAVSHSLMTYPEPMTGQSCRMGGDPKFGVDNCEGPCRIDRFIDENGDRKKYPWTAVFPPNNPVKEVFKRGQKVTVKYTRNNHAPGGFNRFTLVRFRNESVPEADKDYMDKAIHTRNAFHYSCWGARPVVANPDELKYEGEYGLTLIGSDSQEHDQAAGYYITDITIPPVVPDGLYILGWVWFGGTGGKITSNDPLVPKKYGYFSDYWSCSFIKIEGGVPLAQSYTPVFDNDYLFDKNSPGAEGSEEGCMSANDKPGVCVSEPCQNTDGIYQKPAAFKNGTPAALTPANFGGESTDGVQQESEQESEQSVPSLSASPKVEETLKQPEEELPTPSASPLPKVKEEDKYVATPKEEEESPKPSPSQSKAPMKEEEKDAEDEVSFTDKNKAFKTCQCLYYGSRCSSSLAAVTYGCKGQTRRSDQPSVCKKVCCDLCKPSNVRFCKYMRMKYC